MRNSKKTKRDTASTKRSLTNCNFQSRMKIHWGIKSMIRKSMMYWAQRWIGMSNMLRARWSRIAYSANRFQLSYQKRERYMNTINIEDQGAQMLSKPKKRKRMVKRLLILLKRKRRPTQLHLFKILLIRLHLMYHQIQMAPSLLVLSLSYNHFHPGKFVLSLRNSTRKTALNS